MTLTADAPQDSKASQAIHARLLAVHDALGLQCAASVRDDLGSLLEALVLHASEQSTPAETWLLLVGLIGAFPEQAEVLEARRNLELLPTGAATRWLLVALQKRAREWGSTLAELDIVTDRAVVEVNYSARYPHVTGVQRVVRETAKVWRNQHDVELVVWNSVGGSMRDWKHVGGAFRRLTGAEQGRVSDADHSAEDGVAAHADAEPANATVVVPWGVPLILLEVPVPEHSGRLAAMARFSPTPIRLVGYDCIPVVSADLVPNAEPEKFGHYVELLKFSDRVAAISDSAATEFGGVVSAMSAQGLAGPKVTACHLPNRADLTGGSEQSAGTADVPVVLCTGTVGPRKNQASVLLAAELLWRKGIEFELRLLGSTSGMGTAMEDLVERLHAAGRRLVIERRPKDRRIAESLREARVSVFPSLHEGFGLPVVEALSANVPVITSNHGSLAEIAKEGGAMVVDPEDPVALADAMHGLLLDDELHARLVAEARNRPVRTWHDYARDLWAELGA